jgi:quinol-cytochrome oxidoreductase complex cytochrome b subunit
VSGLWADLRDACVALPRRLAAGLFPGGRGDGSAAQRLRRFWLYHLFPFKVTERALAPRATFALGLITLVLFLVLVGTGLLLMLYYVPTPAGAYASMLDLESVVFLGSFVRRLHRFAGHAMVVTVGLHLVRVFAMAAYRGRELNWTLGLGLLLLVLGLAFTGYLLPWDQTSFWAVRVVTAMTDHLPFGGAWLQRLALGGSEVSGATLVRFYALHVALLPAAAITLVALHLWRIRKDGGLARPASADGPTVPAWPHLTLRVGVVALLVVCAMLLLASLVAAPLGPPADVLRPSNPEKAPWYFLGIQEMVSYSARVGGVLFPLVLGLGLWLLPFVDREEAGVGAWFGQRAERLRMAGVALVGLVAGVALVVWYLEPAGAAWVAAQSPALQELTNPAAAMLGLGGLLLGFFGWRGGSVRAGLRTALLVWLVALVLFTLVGLCRGPDWVFFWPWEGWPLAF